MFHCRLFDFLFICRLWYLLHFVQESKYTSHHKYIEFIHLIIVEFNIPQKGSLECLPTGHWSSVPSQWEWPPNLLLFALVTALCQFSFRHSVTYQHLSTVHRPGLSAWTKSKQITFPAVTDLQPSDRTACQRTTTTQQNTDESSLPFPPHLWIAEVLRALRFHRAWARIDQSDVTEYIEYPLLYSSSFSYCPDTELRSPLQEGINTRH